LLYIEIEIKISIMEENNVYTTEEQVIESLGNVSNEKLLEIILERLEYSPVKDVLVKPLSPIMLKKIKNVPVQTDELDEEGKPLMKMEEQEVEVESIFREGVVLAVPSNVLLDEAIKVGAIVVFNHKFNTIEFDLFKDSVLVKPYDILFTKNESIKAEK
jgi:hypothetical protein